MHHWLRGSLLVCALASCANGCPNLDGTQRRGDNLQCGGERGAAGGNAIPDSADGGRYAHCMPVGELGLRCEEQFVLQGKADVVWVIDNSGSMQEEIKGVKDNVGRFVNRITTSGVDVQVVFVSQRSDSAGYYGIQINESDKVHQVDALVDSTNGPDVLLANVGGFAAHQRTGATRHVIFVTDDDSDMGGSAFISTTDFNTALSGRVVHAVAGFSLDDCPDIANVGLHYEEMVTLTGGLKLPICCEDYGALLDTLAGDISASALGLKLTHGASGSSIHVFLVGEPRDGGNDETELTTGWHWDAERRTVVFDDTDAIPPGSVLRVKYAALD